MRILNKMCKIEGNTQYSHRHSEFKFQKLNQFIEISIEFLVFGMSMLFQFQIILLCVI